MIGVLSSLVFARGRHIQQDIADRKINVMRLKATIGTDKKYCRLAKHEMGEIGDRIYKDNLPNEHTSTPQ